MVVAVGSQNPVKLEAVQTAFQKAWPLEQWKIMSTAVKSGVSEQPLSDQEMIRGAMQRAAAALSEVAPADYGVGLEGGLHRLNAQWFGRSWIAVKDRSGQVGIGASATCRLPDQMMKLVHNGKTMSQVCELLYGRKDIGRKEGYFGLLTNNLITRTSGYRDGVIMALAAFLHPQLQEVADA